MAQENTQMLCLCLLFSMLPEMMIAWFNLIKDNKTEYFYSYCWIWGKIIYNSLISGMYVSIYPYLCFLNMSSSTHWHLIIAAYAWILRSVSEQGWGCFGKGSPWVVTSVVHSARLLLLQGYQQQEGEEAVVVVLGMGNYSASSFC